MSSLFDLALTIAIILNLALLGSGRLAICVRLSAFQGIALGFLPILIDGDVAFDARRLLVSATVFALKGVVFPRLLLRAIRTTELRGEVAPLVGYAASIVLGIALTALSFWPVSRLQLPMPAISPLVVPAALSTILIGLLLIVARREAVMQVVGYLTLENGIFIFGVVLARDEPLLVEMGILLDIFVAIFVMGIMIFHIGRAFDHIDADQLSELKD